MPDKVAKQRRNKGGTRHSWALTLVAGAANALRKYEQPMACRSHRPHHLIMETIVVACSSVTCSAPNETDSWFDLSAVDEERCEEMRFATPVVDCHMNLPVLPFGRDQPDINLA